MKCKHVQKVLLDISEKDLLKMEPEIQKHIKDCLKCRKFFERLIWMRESTSELLSFQPSEKVLQKTRALCHNEIKSALTPAEVHPLKYKVKARNHIWIALTLVLGLIQILIISLFPDNVDSNTLSFQKMMVSIMMFQNMMMLFFAPIIFKTYRLRNGWIKIG